MTNERLYQLILLAFSVLLSLELVWLHFSNKENLSIMLVGIFCVGSLNIVVELYRRIQTNIGKKNYQLQVSVRSLLKEIIEGDFERRIKMVIAAQSDTDNIEYLKAVNEMKDVMTVIQRDFSRYITLTEEDNEKENKNLRNLIDISQRVSDLIGDLDRKINFQKNSIVDELSEIHQDLKKIRLSLEASIGDFEKK